MIGADRRIYPRAEVRWPVSAMTAEGSLQGETMNLSMMGAFIRIDHQHPRLGPLVDS